MIDGIVLPGSVKSIFYVLNRNGYEVDIVLVGTLQEAIDFVKTKPKSHIGTANMEGLVCRPAVEMLDRMGRRVITKIKVCDFAE